MEIGTPKKTVVIQPLEVPIPQRREAPAEPVVAAPERELVPA